MKLTGKRIVITRPRGRAEEFARALRAAGAQPVFFPVLKIEPPEDYAALDFAIQNLTEYAWLVLTSVHGAESFFKRLEVHGLQRPEPPTRVAAVGPRTAQYLSEHGLWVDYVPNEYQSDALLAGFGGNFYGKRFLFPQSNLARTTLANAIRAAGGLVTEVIAYRNLLHEPAVDEINDLRAGVDVVTFTSPSTVRNFVDVLQRNQLDPQNLPGAPVIACIGPVTKQAVEEAGLSNVVVAAEYTTDGLIEALA